MKLKVMLIVMLIAASLALSMFALPISAQTTQTCEQCGMTVDATSQAHFRVVDVNGTVHYAECAMCALKLLAKYDSLNITSYCDYNGPSTPITIVANQHGAVVTVNPSTALVIAGGGCMKNRIVSSQAAANALLANNGTSDYLAPIQKYMNGVSGMLVTVPSNSTIMTIAQAALQFGGATPSPTPNSTLSPSPTVTPSPTPSPTLSPTPTEQPTLTPTAAPTESPSPTQTPATTVNPTVNSEHSATPEATTTATPEPTNTPTANPTPTAAPTQNPTNLVTQTCEVCGMDVTPADQLAYRVTDGSGNVHYVECFSCALETVKTYESVHIVTYCDWYGPNYPIVIDSSNYGKTVTVSPPTAMFLMGGSCVTNRAAYNQTAADQLLTNGFSSYTLPEQQYQLPAGTTVSTVKDAIAKIAQVAENAQQNPGLPQTTVFAIVAVVGVAVIAGAAVAYKKLGKHV